MTQKMYEAKILIGSILLALLVLLLASVAKAELSRSYHLVDPDKMDVNVHTHVRVQGYVTYDADEADGDGHIRICSSPKVQGMDRKKCVVAECIPRMPCPLIYTGDIVVVDGISRFDKELNHNWYEIHPVERIEVIGRWK